MNQNRTTRQGFEPAQQGFDSGWLLIIISFVLFWPLGLFLLYKKLRSNKANLSMTKLLPIGGVILLLIGFSGMWDVINSLFYSGFDFYLISDFLRGLFFCIGGLILFGVRQVTVQRDGMNRKYMTIVGSRNIVSIRTIAEAMPVSYDKACKDLQRMIDQGFFGDATYLDMKTGCIILDGSIRPEPEPQVKTEAKPDEAEETDQFQAVLKEIRRLNDAISDETLTAQIYRMETVTAKIFDLVKEQPEKAAQIRSFLNYYLPTTLKLLRSYSQLERQGVQGENITKAKANIENIMERLVKGYERQLDQLFTADVLDISSEIDVLERMMAKDGFTDDNRIQI